MRFLVFSCPQTYLCLEIIPIWYSFLISCKGHVYWFQGEKKDSRVSFLKVHDSDRVILAIVAMWAANLALQYKETIIAVMNLYIYIYIYIVCVPLCVTWYVLFVGSVYRTKTMRQLLCFKSKFLTTLCSHLDVTCSYYFWSSLFNMDDESLHTLDK